MNWNWFEILCYVVGPPQNPTNFTLVNSTDTSIVVEWIPRYNGGHEQTFNIQHRIVNESKIWMTHEIPQYNKQTYTLWELKGATWYELRIFAENKFDKSNVTDIQSISTGPSIEKGTCMACRESIFCFLIFSIVLCQSKGRTISQNLHHNRS
jgi:hypothetical protein